VRPRHTIRVVAFGSEETTGSGDAYAAAHAGERDHIALVGESDLGSGRVVALALPRGLAGSAVEQRLAIALAPLGIIVRRDPPTNAGEDVEPLVASGIPAVELQQDVTHYFDVHHSADDTLDKVNRADLEQNVAAWAILLYLVDGLDEMPH
jgi:Zn-dependent M28 family amino/carboxypeptidase